MCQRVIVCQHFLQLSIKSAGWLAGLCHPWVIETIDNNDGGLLGDNDNQQLATANSSSSSNSNSNYSKRQEVAHCQSAKKKKNKSKKKVKKF